MRSAGAIILLLVMLTVTFSKWVIIAEFKINQKYISENLCVNKNKPRSCCHGKCYLGKQLVKDEKSDAQDLPQKGKEKVDIQLFFETKNGSEIIADKELPLLISYESAFTPQSYNADCFRPPCLIG